MNTAKDLLMQADNVKNLYAQMQEAYRKYLANRYEYSQGVNVNKLAFIRAHRAWIEAWGQEAKGWALFCDVDEERKHEPVDPRTVFKPEDEVEVTPDGLIANGREADFALRYGGSPDHWQERTWYLSYRLVPIGLTPQEEARGRRD